VIPLRDPEEFNPAEALPTESDGTEEVASSEGSQGPEPSVLLPHLNYYGGRVIPNVKSDKSVIARAAGNQEISATPDPASSTAGRWLSRCRSEARSNSGRRGSPV